MFYCHIYEKYMFMKKVIRVKKHRCNPEMLKKKKKKENFCIENDMPTYITYKQQIQKN